MKEREISIVDLMVEILLHWRLFIVWMIGGAVLFGALSYVRSYSDVKQQKMQTDAMLSRDQEKWFTEEETRNAGYVASYEKTCFEKMDYLEKAPIMQLDSNHVSKAEAIIAVIAGNREQSFDIAKVYKGIAESSSLIAKVAEDSGIETLGVNELIHLDKIDSIVVSNESNADTSSISTVYDEEATSFRVTVVYEDEAKCQAMLESAIVFIMEKQPDVENVLGKHDICVVNESIGVVSDMEIANLQKAVLDDIGYMRKNIFDEKKALTDREQQYYELLLGNVTNKEEMIVLRADTALGINIKYV